jgi:hypothetical protein
MSLSLLKVAASRMAAPTYIGKVCSKHPELKGLRRAYNYNCVECARETIRKWRFTNPEKARLSCKKYYKNNEEKASALRTQWRISNPDKVRAFNNTATKKYRTENIEECRSRSRKWAKNNPDKSNATGAKRRAIKLRATPAWARLDVISDIYTIAAVYRAAGISCEVDHIVPLKSTRVQGLHCEANLQLLLAVANLSKGNRWWPDMAAAK